MRAPLVLSALLVAGTPLPALAQDEAESPLSDAVAMMSDPEMQEQASLMAAMLVGALLEMPVGELADSVAVMAGEEESDIDPDARVRDMLGPDAANAPEIVAERLPQMMQGMAGMAGALEAMMPQLREMAVRMRDLHDTE